LIHRFLGQLSALFAVAVLVSVLVWHRRDRIALRLSLAVVPLFIAQAALGAYVVLHKLEAWTVVAHLALAMILMATLILLTIHLSAGPVQGGDRRLTRVIALAGAATYALLLRSEE